ncbi:MAG: hypothetical protein H5U10_15485 [Desulfacinum sp.]|jgi:hypothetical protein|nr:hypothetical protein [Desulfacinum sp.]
MIRDLKPYPSYKDSDVEWLGEVAARLPEEPPEEEPQWSDLKDVPETADADDGSVPPGEEDSDG